MTFGNLPEECFFLKNYSHFFLFTFTSGSKWWMSRKVIKSWRNLSVTLLYMRWWRRVSTALPALKSYHLSSYFPVQSSSYNSSFLARSLRPLQASVTSSASQELKINTLGRVWEFLVIGLIYERFSLSAGVRNAGQVQSQSG